MDIASDYGSEGWGFESLRVHFLIPRVSDMKPFFIFNKVDLFYNGNYFLSQVFGIHLSWMQIFQVMFVLLITSKGAAAVVGSAFITLTATLSAIPVLPLESLAIIFGIDRFMSTGRAITNLVGNAVATVVLDKWHKDS